MLLQKLTYRIFKVGAVVALFCHCECWCHTGGSRYPGGVIPAYAGTTPGIAMTATRQEEIHINSKHLTLDRNKDTAIFSGEVILCFDDIILKTERLQIFYRKTADNKEHIDKIIINTRLIAKKDDDSVLIADYAQYLPQDATLTLIGNIKLQRENHIMETTKLVYHTKLRHIKGIAK